MGRGCVIRPGRLIGLGRKNQRLDKARREGEAWVGVGEAWVAVGEAGARLGCGWSASVWRTRAVLGDWFADRSARLCTHPAQSAGFFVETRGLGDARRGSEGSRVGRRGLARGRRRAQVGRDENLRGSGGAVFPVLPDAPPLPPPLPPALIPTYKRDTPSPLPSLAHYAPHPCSQHTPRQHASDVTFPSSTPTRYNTAS